RVVDEAGAGLPDATVRATNKLTGVPTATKTTADGYFTIGLLQPGDYTLTVLKGDLYDTRTRDQRLTAVDATTVLPEPFVLRKRTGAAIATQATPVPTGTPDPTAQPTPVVQATPVPSGDDATADIAIDINRRNPRRGGVFTREEVSTLPLGATTLTRTFDELALLLPGVAPAPQTLGNIAGPGVGPGVGSAGQFAVNGLRSRSNNFTVDGSDNNDEDIGVRRQGFFALVPQPIESIQEYQVTTLLAPAQYGRNIGAQVNAVSKSGGNQMHGTLYGFLNSSQLNARNTFDFVGANTRLPLQGRPLNNDLNTFGAPRNVFLTTFTDTGVSTQQLFVNNNAGRENSFTLLQGGFVLGGALIRSDVDNYGSERQAGDRRSLFYFISAEGMVLNANQEESFAVPTVEERGIFRTGARGLFFDPLFADLFPLPGTLANNYPTTLTGDALFSFFPFPNSPGGIYGRNTYEAVLPANAQGKILSGKINADFNMFGKPQEFVARYNFTDDWRDIPVTGGALFSTLRPRVRTQNFSTFLNTNLTGNGRPLFNQLRASYGRTRLVFDEVRDQSHLLDSRFARGLPPGEQAFLLNARTLFNNTLPGDTVVTYARVISNIAPTLGTTESTLNQFGSGLLTPVGQINVAGFSPIGVDVFNFPQRRVNNTYQLADTLSTQFGSHNLTFGADTRRTELNSDLPRNARPLPGRVAHTREPLSFFRAALRIQHGSEIGQPED
ncbi:MAG: carboxypeptidase-like regulatory domain-containing protein, partial [Acidobacteria bacterium]|nr:carboxypeptidase-like regulatory domain-containing protein [Acidobacteriota bacterium]